jgi:uncharacterized membrane protein YraQ (UPF0718 family)
MNAITNILTQLAHMVWDIYWGLALGFILSSLIRAFISTKSISARLGKDSVTALSLSTLFGAISSSCSYAAASMARALMIKGATWSNAVAFMVASTNLVFEIFIVIVSPVRLGVLWRRGYRRLIFHYRISHTDQPVFPRKNKRRGPGISNRAGS